jgi:hypothetical protein
MDFRASQGDGEELLRKRKERLLLNDPVVVDKAWQIAVKPRQEANIRPNDMEDNDSSHARLTKSGVQVEGETR